MVERPSAPTDAARRRSAKSGPTAKDVADLAGVSPMTVSRVVNGDLKVRPETRRRVEAAIDDLSYQPNVAARQLAGAESFRIGLPFPMTCGKHYLSELLIGGLEQIGAGGHQFVLKTCETPDGARELIASLIATGVNGLILPPPLGAHPGIIEDLRRWGGAAVVMGPGCPVEDHSGVLIDNREAARAMTRFLLDLGHQRIGFIHGDPRHPASDLRHAGFLEAMRAAGVNEPDRYLAHGSYDFQSGLVAAEALLGQPERPTAIFAANDISAAAVIAFAHRAGLHIPEDLSVAGFDDMPVATTIWPMLTTVRQPIAAMGREAIDLLVTAMRAQAEGRAVEPVRRTFDYTLVTRGSCAAPAAG